MRVDDKWYGLITFHGIPVEHILRHCEDNGLIDPYPRTNKASRGHLHKKYQTPAAAPQLRNATPEQFLMTQQIKNIPMQKG